MVHGGNAMDAVDRRAGVAVGTSRVVVGLTALGYPALVGLIYGARYGPATPTAPAGGSARVLTRPPPSLLWNATPVIARKALVHLATWVAVMGGLPLAVCVPLLLSGGAGPDLHTLLIGVAFCFPML